MAVRLYDEFMADLSEVERLEYDKRTLERIIEHECLGDLERWPYKCELEKVNKRLKELKDFE